MILFAAYGATLVAHIAQIAGLKTDAATDYVYGDLNTPIGSMTKTRVNTTFTTQKWDYVGGFGLNADVVFIYTVYYDYNYSE